MAYAPPFNDNPEKEDAESTLLFLGLFVLPVLLLGFSWFAFDLVRSAYTSSTGILTTGYVEKFRRLHRSPDEIEVRFARPGTSVEERSWVAVGSSVFRDIKKDTKQPIDIVARAFPSTLEPIVVKDFRRRTTMNVVGSLVFLFTILVCIFALFSSWRDRAEAIRNHETRAS